MTGRRSRRGAIGAAIVAAWLGGMGVLVYREYLDPARDTLREAGTRVDPISLYYAAMQGERLIGFGSSQVDTTPSTIEVREQLRVELPIGGRTQPAELRSQATLTRSLALVRFAVVVTAESGQIRTFGEWIADSVFRFIVRTGRADADTQLVTVTGPVYFPSSIPIVLALGAQPSVGRAARLRIVDPIGLAVRETRVRFNAETLFVVHDSAVYDGALRRWVEARPDTVKAWRFDPGSERTLVAGWVDAQGRIVDASQLGTVRLVRRPYEVAIENWRLRDSAARAPVPDDRDILELTAIAANRRITRSTSTLKVVLGGVPLQHYDLVSPRQQRNGDTLLVTRERAELLVADYATDGPARQRFPRETAPEPLIESDDSLIVRTAQRVGGSGPDPTIVARRLLTWVHDSLRKRVTFGVPSARQVLRARSGDCNEHTQLFVALARARGIPARIATGLVHIDGKFYYHAWPEIWLRDWVAVDPTLGQFPADAAHLRFATGGLDRQAELLGLIGRLTIDVVN